MTIIERLFWALAGGAGSLLLSWAWRRATRRPHVFRHVPYIMRIGKGRINGDGA